MTYRFLIGVTLAAAFASPCLAETLKFHTVLAASSEVPPTASKGSGVADAVLDTVSHSLSYDITFEGFSSAVTMAHFHGPASPGANAGVQIALGNAPKSPIHGTAILTAAQQQQFISGQWYVNVHTANNPKGAIRGQMVQLH